MIDKIMETYDVPDFTADEIANVRVIGSVMLFHYWAWKVTPCGILQRVLVAKCRMPVAGVRSSRPLITAALEPSGLKMLEMTAH